MSQFTTFAAVAASIGAGLMAGLFFAFSNFVMGALAQLPSEQGMAAMQRINAAVTNPLFGVVFFGTALLCLAILLLTLRHLPSNAALLLFGGALCYLVGVIGVTIVCNVPLNNMLASTAASQASERWPGYVAEWQRWNHVRTFAGTLSLLLFVLALVKQAGSRGAA